MIFVVVLVSVVVQGGLVPTLARLWHVRMRVVEPEPWALGMRFRDEPEGLHRFVVTRGSAADGSTIERPPARGGRVDQHGQPRAAGWCR